MKKKKKKKRRLNKQHKHTKIKHLLLLRVRVVIQSIPLPNLSHSTNTTTTAIPARSCPWRKSLLRQPSFLNNNCNNNRHYWYPEIIIFIIHAIIHPLTRLLQQQFPWNLHLISSWKRIIQKTTHIHLPRLRKAINITCHPHLQQPLQTTTARLNKTHCPRPFYSIIAAAWNASGNRKPWPGKNNNNDYNTKPSRVVHHSNGTIMIQPRPRPLY